MLRGLTAVVVLLASVSLLAAGVGEVSHPNRTAYSEVELEELIPALARLVELLDSSALTLGRRYPDLWTSLDFAAYAQGILTASGYAAYLVSGVGWPEDPHTWLVVEVPLPSRVAWIPIETAPEPGQPQQKLGHIPLAADAMGVLWFDDRYTRPSVTLDLPANRPPVASVRTLPVIGIPGGDVTFFGGDSRDPDGEIVLWLWTFEDGATSSGPIVDYSFPSEGTHLVKLTVVDSHGASASTTYPFRVVDERRPPAGCGCGG